MNFLAPLFLLGGLAVALPVVFHLIRRTSRERMPFSSLMFLQPTPPRVTRRSRLENIWLLILRCLVLCLLAIGFARPFLPKPLADDPQALAARKIVLLIDTSASLRRADLWADARTRAAEVLRKVSTADQVAVFTFDRQVNRLISFEQWSAMNAGQRAVLAGRQLNAINPGWAGSNLGSALIAAVEALEEKAGRSEAGESAGRRQIVLISDLQEGSHLEALQAFEWPKQIELVVESLKTKRPTNAGVQIVLNREENDTDEAGLRVRVSNSSASRKELFVLRWERPATVAQPAAQMGAVEVYVPPGQSRVVPAPKTASGLLEERLILSGDDDDPSSTFSLGDLKQAPGFAAKLKTSGDAVSTYIRGRLKEYTRRKLANWQTSEVVPSALQQSIFEDLNAIILGPSIWNEARFASVRISQETRDLLGRNPSGKDLARFNELLLEDAYRLDLSRNHNDFDNTAYLVPPKAEQIQILYLGNEAGQDTAQPLFYVQRAFQQTRRQIVKVIPRRAEAGLSPRDLETVSLAVVTEPLREEPAAVLRDYLRAGGTALLVLKQADAAGVIPRLVDGAQVRCEEAASKRYALLGQIDFQHPLFAPFADPRFSDFTKIHFWKHRQVDTNGLPQARVLAGFDNGDPALLQLPAGKGALFVLTSGWQPADSQLALSSKFVPLLYSLLNLSGGIQAQLAQYHVGDEVVLAAAPAGQPLTVRKPDGAEVRLDGARKFAQTDMPGIYRVIGGPSVQQFAVNLDPAESKTAPLPVEELEHLGVTLKPPELDPVRQRELKRHLQSTELENRQKLWRWLILATLLILIVETWLAGRLTRTPAA